MPGQLTPEELRRAIRDMIDRLSIDPTLPFPPQWQQDAAYVAAFIDGAYSSGGLELEEVISYKREIDSASGQRRGGAATGEATADGLIERTGYGRYGPKANK